MDVVLEIFDGLLFDRIYAHFYPLPQSSNTIQSSSNLTLPYPSIRKVSGGPASHNKYHFSPASQYFHIVPGPAAYLTSWTRDDLMRQAISLYVITALFGLVVYFVFATLSYVFVFDKNTFNHPKYLKNQMSLEIRQTMSSIPVMAVLTAPLFWLEVQGYSKLYDAVEDGPGSWYALIQIPFFLIFTDFWIYWIHRGLHHPMVYKRLHKPHHKWIMPTPYASHAFHPLDGFAQSIPYHVFPFLFPLQKWAYVALFVFINVWTVMIHDGEYVADSPVINGAACHTLHHLYFNYNYGQFTTISDRIFGSYRRPHNELFQKETKMSKDEWDRQGKEMEKVVQEVEADDDREYLNDAASEKLR